MAKDEAKLPCPNCGKRRLTPTEKRLGYHCAECAEAAETGFGSDPPLSGTHEREGFYK